VVFPPAGDDGARRTPPRAMSRPRTSALRPWPGVPVPTAPSDRGLGRRWALLLVLSAALAGVRPAVARQTRTAPGQSPIAQAAPWTDAHAGQTPWSAGDGSPPAMGPSAPPGRRPPHPAPGAKTGVDLLRLPLLMARCHGEARAARAALELPSQPEGASGGRLPAYQDLHKLAARRLFPGLRVPGDAPDPLPGQRLDAGPKGAPGESPAGPRAQGLSPDSPAAARSARLACTELCWSAPLPPPELGLPPKPVPTLEPALGRAVSGLRPADRPVDPQGVAWPLPKLYPLRLELPCETGTWVGVALADPARVGDPSARLWLAQGLLGALDRGLRFSLPAEVPWGLRCDLEFWILPPGKHRSRRVRQAVEVLEAWSWDLPGGGAESAPSLRLSGLEPQARYAAWIELWPLSSEGAAPLPKDPRAAPRKPTAACAGTDSLTRDPLRAVLERSAPPVCMPLGRHPAAAEAGIDAARRSSPGSQTAERADGGLVPNPTEAVFGPTGMGTWPPESPDTPEQPSAGLPTVLELCSNSAGQAWLPAGFPQSSRARRLVVWLRPLPTSP
jgi:hypothetical protein